MITFVGITDPCKSDGIELDKEQVLYLNALRSLVNMFKFNFVYFDIPEFKSRTLQQSTDIRNVDMIYFYSDLIMISTNYDYQFKFSDFFNPCRHQKNLTVL